MTRFSPQQEHRTLRALVLAGLGALWIAGSAAAQPINLFFKYTQVWTRPLCSHVSVVRTCPPGPPAIFAAAFDDWVCTRTGPIVRVEWWGTQPFATKPPPRAFYISFYANAAGCNPGTRLYQTCVLAGAQLVGTDCCGKRVFKFGANIAGFSQTEGTHYWIQISESDLGINMVNPSPTIEAPDFEWSAHRPIVGCNARGQTPGVPGYHDLFSFCQQVPEKERDDLAFRLASRIVIVITGNTGFGGPPVEPCNPNFPGTEGATPNDYSIFLRRTSDGAVIEVLHATADSDGVLALDPESPDGTYNLEIRGPGVKSTYVCGVNLVDGTTTNLGSVPLIGGDANGDNQINFFDITYVLANFNR